MQMSHVDAAGRRRPRGKYSLLLARSPGGGEAGAQVGVATGTRGRKSNGPRPINFARPQETWRGSQVELEARESNDGRRLPSNLNQRSSISCADLASNHALSAPQRMPPALHPAKSYRLPARRRRIPSQGMIQQWRNP